MMQATGLPPATWVALGASMMAVTGLTAVAHLTGRAKGARAARAEDGQEPKPKIRVGRAELIAPAIATVVSADGMWETFHGIAMPLLLRFLAFAFIEINIIQAARRARASQEDGQGAGADGVAMWVLTAVSAFLSVAYELHSPHPNFAAVGLRFGAPFIAAWGWERQLKLERRRLKLGRKIAWRVTPERILVKLGLAEPTERTAAQVDAQRRITRVARAAHRVRLLKAAEAREWRIERAERRLQRAAVAATEHAALATDPAQRKTLLAQLATLYGAADLADLDLDAPWAALEPRRPASETLMDRLELDRRDRTYGVRTPARTEPTREGSLLPREPRTGVETTAAPEPRTEGAHTEAPRTKQVRTPRTEGAHTEAPRTKQVRTPRTPKARTEPVHAARTPRTSQVSVSVQPSRAAFAAELAERIRTALPAVWEPDYEALKEESGYGRSWCEKAVHDARIEAAKPRTKQARTGSRAEQPRTTRTTRTARTPVRPEPNNTTKGSS